MVASLVWRCLLGLAPVHLCELCYHIFSAMSSRSLRSSQQVFFLVSSAVPLLSRAAHFPWWAPRPGMGYLPNIVFFLEPSHLRFFLTLRLLLLALLELGAHLSSFPENTLYE